MTWMARLYETYDKASEMDFLKNDRPAPISHTLQNAHINVIIDAEGNFKHALVLEKRQIILPATESSAGRSSGEAPHPLADKLQYIAKDYALYGGLKKAYFDSYRSQLYAWCHSDPDSNALAAVYRYIEKGHVIADLIQAKIVFVDENKKLLTKWLSDSPSPELFKILPKEKGSIDQGSALVCWSVQVPGEQSIDTWKDEKLYESWIKFNASRNTEKDLCYVSGGFTPVAINHPARLRHTGDKAKLISSNDSQGFTYRGRFAESEQACSVSFDVTQKAHNALRWLISRQGYSTNDQVIIAWAISMKKVPEVMSPTFQMIDFDNADEIDNDEEVEPINKRDHSRDLGESFAENLNIKMRGYRKDLGDYDNIIIMAIDSASPGRMAITYYQEYFSKEFIDLIEQWHLDFAWMQRYTKKNAQSEREKKPVVCYSVSAPAPYAIANAVYGKTLTDSLRKKLLERLIPCIVEGQSFPFDIVNACVDTCTKYISNRKKEDKEWETNLGVTCALYRGFYKRNKSERRDYSVTLETKRTSRDYLYGRLLAVADNVESYALKIMGENRPTNAERLMQSFAGRPYSTWRTIELSLRPYMQKLKSNPKTIGFLYSREKILDEIFSILDQDERRTSNEKLSGEFLLGYHCQRQQLYSKTDNEDISETVE